MEIKSNLSIAIIAPCKMEELYIREWLDWHLNIVGIDHIFLCDNNDINYSPSLDCIVQDYIDKQQVTIINYKGKELIQHYCYSETYNKYGHNYDWFVLVDVDEFLHLPKFNNQIKQFLQYKHIQECVYFSVICCLYNDNNLIQYDNRPCQERFTNKITPNKILFNTAYTKNGYQIKSIIKGKEFVKPNTVISNQHDALAFYHDIPRIDIFGNEIKKAYINLLLKDEYEDIDKELYLKNFYNTFHIKHYHTKTIDEYIKYKIYRGDVWVGNLDKVAYPYKLSNFFEHNEYTKEKELFIKDNYPELYKECIAYKNSNNIKI